MQRLASINVRLFLTAWIVYTVHFTTNVVREHYPAFTLVDHFSFKVDEYEGFHSDIFRHRDGHCYVANQVATSVITAVPLLVFDPLLDALEAYSKRKLAESEQPPEVTYRTKYPNRQKLFRMAKERGLDLRFGAATFITSAFLIAPLSALTVVFLYQLLRVRGVDQGRAIWLALLFGFGTPVFYRTGHLNHNMFEMWAVFLAFGLLWLRQGPDFSSSQFIRFAAGFLAGFSLAVDYSGAVPLLLLHAYLVVSRWRAVAFRRSFAESLIFVLGSIPPVLFLLYSQWIMFGDPFLPAQYWMPNVNEYNDEGWRGFDWPAPDLFVKNLFDPAYGLFPFGPLLLIGFIPTWFYARTSLVLPRFERIWMWCFVFAFLVFCAANQFSRLQWNTGFRYLVPLVPFIYLAACDHLVRLRPVWLAALSIPTILNSWVISMAPRGDTIPEAWRRIIVEGPQLPWLTVLHQTLPMDQARWLAGPVLPILVLGACLALIAVIWSIGERAASHPPNHPVSD